LSAHTIKVIAIDGETASGKGEASRMVAQRLGFDVLDSGLIYRTITLACMERNIPLQAEGEVNGFLDEILPLITVCEGIIHYRNEPVGEKARTPEVSRSSPLIGQNPYVRKAVIPLQRRFATERGLVADGRDMTSVVFTDARLKVFLTASPEVRAERRFAEYQRKGIPTLYDHVLEDLKRRDRQDMTRADAPLIQVPDAHLINSDCLDAYKVSDRIIELWERVNAVVASV
jgi:CMP/dCMP kinase